MYGQIETHSIKTDRDRIFSKWPPHSQKLRWVQVLLPTFRNVGPLGETYYNLERYRED